MPRWGELLDDMERMLDEVEQLDPSVRDRVWALLDGVDALHRRALDRLGAHLSEAQCEALRGADPAIDWLFAAYSVGVDERAAAEAALNAVRPYLHSHGGEATIVDASGGVVRAKLSGACAGCTASSVTLRHGVEEALRERLPGFVALEIEDDDAASHPPPEPQLLRVENYEPRS